MLDTILTGGELTIPIFLAITLTALALGVGCAMVYLRGASCTRSFSVTLAMLPAMVAMVILLVNGNLGTGVAVMGAFSLVRVRSLPGTAREIGAIFLAMALGLAAGMGYLAVAAIFFVIMAAFLLIMDRVKLPGQSEGERELKITIPESLDYEGIFDDLLAEYTGRSELVHVKTASMGSLYELKYRVTMKPGRSEKEFIDQLRCRNGNLNISLGRAAAGGTEL